MKIKSPISIMILVILLTISFSISAQCPMCKASLEGARQNGTEVGNTVNSGILYLLALPYSIATVFGVILYRNNKLKKLKNTIGNEQ
jgi:hypothetical protein